MDGRNILHDCPPPACGITITFSSPLSCFRKGLVSINSIELQLATALQRFNTLQRRVDADPGQSSTLLSRALHELERALEEVRVAQEQLLENQAHLEDVQVELAQQYEKYWQLFDDMPQPYVVTGADSTIAEANKAAAELLNVSQRFLVGKPLSVFICQERGRFLEEAARAAAGAAAIELTVKLRPRERAPIDVAVTVSGGSSSLRWILRPKLAIHSADALM
jgi:PAS domain-containing protein